VLLVMFGPSGSGRAAGGGAGGRGKGDGVASWPGAVLGVVDAVCFDEAFDKLVDIARLG
jgi:hypothetical protein